MPFIEKRVDLPTSRFGSLTETFDGEDIRAAFVYGDLESILVARNIHWLRLDEPRLCIFAQKCKDEDDDSSPAGTIYMTKDEVRALIHKLESWVRDVKSGAIQKGAHDRWDKKVKV